MRIVLCANTSWYIYNFRKNLIAELKKHGHEVYVIAPFDKHTNKLFELEVKWFHINVHQTGKNPFKELRTLMDLFYLLKSLQPDILLTFTIKCNIYAGLINRIYQFSQIANVSGLGEIFDVHTPFTTVVQYLYRIALNNSQKVFFQNAEDLDLFIQQGILPVQLCEQLPGSGVDLSVFTPLFDCLEHTKRVFLMFGRIVPGKGYDLFLEAARRIKQAQANNAEFWILGIEDTSRRESIELFRKILAYYDQKIITYMPPTDDVVPIIQQAHVVVLPSRYNEGVPRSLLEAMACGKPIITTNWKGCRETVDEGINGYLIEKGDLRSLIHVMEFFIHADKKVLYNMGRASRQKVEQEFDENVVIAKYLREIQSLYQEA